MTRPDPEAAPDPVQPDRIELRGLRVLGAHGVLPEEQQRAQPFEVDLDLELDLRPAGRSDALADTVDYGPSPRPWPRSSPGLTSTCSSTWPNGSPSPPWPAGRRMPPR